MCQAYSAGQQLHVIYGAVTHAILKVHYSINLCDILTGR